MKVLVVDDEQLIVWSIRRMLEKEGIAVVTALSGEEARIHLETELFDLIVTDDRMPGICGQDLIKEIRGRAGSRTKCLLMSGALDPEDGNPVSADGFIEKPFLLKELRRKIFELAS